MALLEHRKSVLERLDKIQKKMDEEAKVTKFLSDMYSMQKDAQAIRDSINMIDNKFYIKKFK